MISPDKQTNSRKIDINFNFFNYQVPIIDVIQKLGMRTEGDNFYFSNENYALSVNSQKNCAIDNTYNKKYSVLELVSAEKDCTIYQAAMFLSVYYPEGIRSMNDTGYLSIINNDIFWKTYGIDKNDYINKITPSYKNNIIDPMPIHKLNCLLNALELREKEIKQEHKEFLKRFKLEHTIPVRNEKGQIEEIKANGFNETDYQYILEIFSKECNQIESMYQLFASCYRDLLEKEDKNNKNFMDELEYP